MIPEVIFHSAVPIRGPCGECRKTVAASPQRFRAGSTHALPVWRTIPGDATTRSVLPMKIDAERVIRLRKERSWSQDELAIASGLNLRTVQRVERHASASLQTRKALAAALDVDSRELDGEGLRMKPCPVCGSDEVYLYKTAFTYGLASGEVLLPGLGGLFSAPARIRPSMCAQCGHVRFFASEDARKQLGAS